MKIVTCFTPGALRAETSVSILSYAPSDWFWHQHVLDPEDPHAYARVLANYWAEAEGFFVVEPDIVITEDVTDEAVACPHPYCAWPYAWTTNVGPALGCTLFRKEILEAHPTAMLEVMAMNVTWRQVDVMLMRHVLLKKYGWQPHVHLPPVVHLNDEKKLLPEADPTPMLEIPDW